MTKPSVPANGDNNTGGASFLNQLDQGAHVITTASAANTTFVKSMGADEEIDYQKTPFEMVVKDVDVVIDMVGGDLLERLLKVLRPGGKLVAVAGMIPPEFGKAEGIPTVSANARRSLT